MALASARKRFARHYLSAVGPSAVELSSLGVCSALADVAIWTMGDLFAKVVGPWGDRNIRKR
jgi:hypothetical protein